uniref:Uncharacterized protein n=1 Tax=Rhizophora mucronata TaxID=61149 RepID=A0A2P2PY27_RHIMU
MPTEICWHFFYPAILFCLGDLGQVFRGDI